MIDRQYFDHPRITNETVIIISGLSVSVSYWVGLRPWTRLWVFGLSNVSFGNTGKFRRDGRQHVGNAAAATSGSAPDSTPQYTSQKHFHIMGSPRI